MDGENENGGNKEHVKEKDERIRKGECTVGKNKKKKMRELRECARRGQG